MDPASESDDSDGMRDLVERGYAIRRERKCPRLVMGRQGETRARIRDSDVSHVQRPLTLTESAAAVSTHGLNPVTQSLVTAAGRNKYTIGLVLGYAITFQNKKYRPSLLLCTNEMLDSYKNITIIECKTLIN